MADDRPPTALLWIGFALLLGGALCWRAWGRVGGGRDAR